MFKLKYNILALIQVSISFLNYFLLMRVFGVSDMTDAYLITMAIFGSLVLVQMLTTEQFLFFFNDIKAYNLSKAHSFYAVALTVALSTGILTFMLSYFGSSMILSLFVSNLESSRLLLIESLFQIAIIELLVGPIQILNQKLMNAEMYFSLPYILNIIPTFFVLISTLYIYVYNINDISLLLYARVLGALLIVPLSFMIVKYMGVPIKLTLSHPELKAFLKNSFTMRLGHNVHNFLFTPITTNLLTLLPSGYASYFYYALKIATIINGVIVGPSTKVFQSQFSKEWSLLHIDKAKLLMKKYLATAVPLLVVSGVGGYFILPFLLHLIADKLSTDALFMIQSLFAGLMVWQLIILAESTNVLILIVEKKSKMFIYTNLLFSFMYFSIAYVLFKEYSIYAVIYALIVSQIINYLIYTYYGQKILQLKVNSRES